MFAGILVFALLSTVLLRARIRMLAHCHPFIQITWLLPLKWTSTYDRSNAFDHHRAGQNGPTVTLWILLFKFNYLLVSLHC